MKRLSAIIALALVITVGGVFAAWHYNRGEVSLEITRTAVMASVQSDTAKGSIVVDHTANNNQGNTIKFLVDDVDTIDWKAALVPSGSVYVKFTPAANADSNVQTNGIKMKATVTVTGTQAEYEGIKILTAAVSNSFTVSNTATKDAVEITAEQIANCLVFNENQEVVLNTYDKNVAFENAMNTYTIVITITELA